jgi:tripartite ATP-independent transporter DctP family solute receptor
VFAGTLVGDEKDTIEQARVGALDLVRINVAPMNGICPATMVPTLPFLFRSKQHMRDVLDGPIGDELLRACEAQGFVGLAFYDSGSRSLYTVKRPVRKPADLRGLNVRVQQSELWVGMVEAMGAKATPMPYGSVYTALKNGLVDAAENNWPSYDTSKHHEIAKYYSLTEHSMAPEMLLMSKRVWDTLDASEQQLFRETARASVTYMRRLWDEKERVSRSRVESAGAQVIEVDKKAFRDVVGPVYERFITDDRLKQMIRAIQSGN